jgi:hypothetical protein
MQKRKNFIKEIAAFVNPIIEITRFKKITARNPGVFIND